MAEEGASQGLDPQFFKETYPSQMSLEDMLRGFQKQLGWALLLDGQHGMVTELRELPTTMGQLERLLYDVAHN